MAGRALRPSAGADRGRRAGCRLPVECGVCVCETDRLRLDRRQVWIYLAAIGAGLATGSAIPALGPIIEAWPWPAPAVLALPDLCAGIAHRPRGYSPGCRMIRCCASRALGTARAVHRRVHHLQRPRRRRRCLARPGGRTGQLIAQLGLLPLYLWLVTGLDFKVVLVPPISRRLPPSCSCRLARRRSPNAGSVRPDNVPCRASAWRGGQCRGLSWRGFLIAKGTGRCHAPGARPAADGGAAVLAFLVLAALLAKVLVLPLKRPTRQRRTLAYRLGTRATRSWCCRLRWRRPRAGSRRRW